MADIDRLVNTCLLPGLIGPEVPPWLDEALGAGLAGAVLFPGPSDTPDTVRDLARALRRGRPDVLVAIDEEGGDVTRLERHRGSGYPGNLALGVVDDLQLTAEVADAIAADLVAADVNVNLAPS